MRLYLLIIATVVALSGCAAVRGPGGRLIDTQPSLVTHCEPLGVLAETADADRISTVLARRGMVRAVEARAVQLGATHLVWLHKTDTSAAAGAYRCPN